MSELTTEQIDDLRQWVASRPTEVQDLIERFPPMCAVKATRQLGIPAEGCIGHVVSYIEPDHLRIRGRWQGLGPFMDAECDAADIELVEEGLITSDLVRELRGARQ